MLFIDYEHQLMLMQTVVSKGLCQHSRVFFWAAAYFFNCSKRGKVVCGSMQPSKEKHYTQHLFSVRSTFLVWPFWALRFENIWTFQKGAGDVMVAPFQATNYVLDGAWLVTHHPGNQENGVEAYLTMSFYPELYQTKTIITEIGKPICGSRSAEHWMLACCSVYVC